MIHQQMQVSMRFKLRLWWGMIDKEKINIILM
jgi:hypothetical protein